MSNRSKDHHRSGADEIPLEKGGDSSGSPLPAPSLPDSSLLQKSGKQDGIDSLPREDQKGYAPDERQEHPAPYASDSYARGEVSGQPPEDKGGFLVGNRRGKKLGIRNIDFLQEILEKEVLPNQVIREFTQNSIQAIQARCVRQNLKETRGTVQWSMYPLSFERFSVAKLACIDTGEGMSGEDLAEYIGNLASSGREQGLSANFGFGAKISAMKYNPAGLVYETWQNGEGHRLILFRDGESNNDIKLRYFHEGEVLHIDHEPLVQRIPEEEMPALIREHGGFGTMVIFLGQDEKRSDTIAVPENYDGKKDDWVAWTLSHRYFSFPRGIDIRTAVNHSKNPRKWHAVDGVEDFLERNHKEKGVIYLPGLEVLWYTLKHHRVYSEEKSIFDSGAKIGFLYDEELYGYRTESSAQAKMQHSLGIPFNANKIALFFRPEKVDINLTRSDIKINGLAVPEEDWFRAFKKNMPSAIKKLIIRQEDTSLEKSTHYKGLMSFLKPRRRLQASSEGKKKGGSSGQDEVDKVNVKLPVANATEPIKTAPEATSNRAEKTSEKTGNATSQQKGVLLKQGGGRRAKFRNLSPEELAPRCSWVKEKDAGMEGVAVRYLALENKLLLNESFPMIRSLIRDWQNKKAEDQKETVALAIKKLIAVQAIDEVVNIKRLEGEAGWDSEKVEKMLADDYALTMGVVNLYYLSKTIHNTIQHLPARED